MVTDQATINQFGMDNGVVAIESDSDKKTKSLVKSHVQFHDFVYCSFDNYLPHINGETTQEKVKVRPYLWQQFLKCMHGSRGGSGVQTTAGNFIFIKFT